MGHNFVKYMTIEIPKSHADLQIMMKRSAQFQVNLIKNSTCKISNQSDERRRRSCGDRISDGRTDGRNDGRKDGLTHGRTRVISIVPLRLRRMTKTHHIWSSAV